MPKSACEEYMRVSGLDVSIRGTGNSVELTEFAHPYIFL